MRMRFRDFLRRRYAACREARESGSALVETAAVLPLLITILIGGAELARVAYAAIEVSNAARAGAQYGAQNGFTASDTTGISNAAAADAANLSGLSTSSSYTCICSDGTSSTCQPTDCTNSKIEQTLTVNTQASFNPLIRLPGLPTTYTLKGQAVQKCAQ